MKFRFTSLVTVVLALCLAGCETEEQKKTALAAKLREKTSIPDQSGDQNFQAFIGRLRLAVGKHDLPMIASMMTPNFGWRLDPPGEGDGVFDYWDKKNIWPELNLVLKERFVASGQYMVSPREFVSQPTYRGYRAGIVIYEGGWRFAYFVNN